WLQFLRAHTPSIFNLTTDTDVFVENTETIKVLGSVLKKQSFEDILNVIGWQFALRYTDIVAKNVPSMTLEDGDDKMFAFVCERQLSEMYGELLSSEYALRNFPMEQKIKVSRFLNKVKNYVVGKLQALDSGERLNKEALDSASRLKFDIWPSIAIGGIVKDAFPGNEASFIAYWIETRKASRGLLGTIEYDDMFNGLDNFRPPFSYRQRQNAMLVGLEVLSSPLYYVDVPDAVSYGGLGAKIAGHIVRALYPEDNATTSGEPGLEAAFDLLDLDGPGKMSVKEARQVFFVTYCVASCGSQDSTCNAAMRSFEPFVRAFSCSSSSYMGGGKTSTFF
ncbi:unnamed protein product, partial [Ixodes hexagonus]